MLAAVLALIAFHRRDDFLRSPSPPRSFSPRRRGAASAFYFRDDDIAAYAGDEPRIAKLELLIDQPAAHRRHAFQSAPRPMPPQAGDDGEASSAC